MYELSPAYLENHEAIVMMLAMVPFFFIAFLACIYHDFNG